MPIAPKPEIEKIELCIHGSPDYEELARLGISPADLVDFSVNSNPLGPPPELQAELGRAVVDRYPDARASVLRQHLAERLGISVESILPGNGSVELMWLVALAYLDAGDHALILGPTFGEYETACRIVGAEVVRVSAQPGDFRLDVPRVAERVWRDRPKVVFLCNPNNPTGQYLSRAEVEELLGICQESLLVLDEAYVGFVEEPWGAAGLLGKGNLVILRSLTKDHALAGLRLGFALSEPSIIATLQKVQPTWSVNALAQAAGLITLVNEDYLVRSREAVRQAKDYLVGELSEMGLQCVPSRTNFFLVRVGDGRRFRADLLSRGILVRDCTSFGLPEYVRLATRPLTECRRLIEAAREVIEQKSGGDGGDRI